MPVQYLLLFTFHERFLVPNTSFSTCYLNSFSPCYSGPSLTSSFHSSSGTLACSSSPLSHFKSVSLISSNAASVIRLIILSSSPEEGIFFIKIDFPFTGMYFRSLLPIRN